MPTKIPSKTVYGTKMRANNNRPETFARAWSEFLKIAPPKEQEIYAVYTNYVGDYTQDFDFIIATEDEKMGKTFRIPSGRYYIWDTESQNPGDVPKAWTKIWESDIKRAYKTDFELYIPGESIKIYLSVKRF